MNLILTWLMSLNEPESTRRKLRGVRTPDAFCHYTDLQPAGYRGERRSWNGRHSLIRDDLNDPQIVSLQVELISVPLANTVPEHCPPDGRLEL